MVSIIDNINYSIKNPLQVGIKIIEIIMYVFGGYVKVKESLFTPKLLVRSIPFQTISILEQMY